MIAFKNSTNALQGARPGSSQSEGPSSEAAGASGGPRTARKTNVSSGFTAHTGTSEEVRSATRVLTKFLPWLSAASIPGQERLQGDSQLDFQNYSGRSRDRGRARRGRIPQGHGAHANFSASRSFACALCSARQRRRKKKNPAVLCWEPECTAALRRLFALLAVTRGTCCGSTAS